MSRAFVNPLSRNDPGVAVCARAVKQWTRDILALAEDAVVSVNELACHLPGCPPRETVILVMRAGEQTFQVSMHKAMRDVTRDDVETALAEASPKNTDTTRFPSPTLEV